MVPDCLVYVDYLSHQVYGESGPPAFVETRQSSVKWTDWVGAKARFVPSLTRPQHENGDYERTREHFRKLGIEATGYVLWPTASASAAKSRLSIGLAAAAAGASSSSGTGECCYSDQGTAAESCYGNHPLSCPAEGWCAESQSNCEECGGRFCPKTPTPTLERKERFTCRVEAKHKLREATCAVPRLQQRAPKMNTTRAPKGGGLEGPLKSLGS